MHSAVKGIEASLFLRRIKFQHMSVGMKQHKWQSQKLGELNDSLAEPIASAE